MNDVDGLLLESRALVLRDLEATGVADAETVSMLERSVASRRGWLEAWEEGRIYVSGLVAQDVQDALLDSRGRWPVCSVCPAATHPLYVHPELGGPDPVWTCEETGRAVAPLGRLGERPAGPV